MSLRLQLPVWGESDIARYFFASARDVVESYILSLVKCMAEERKQKSRLWLWMGMAGVLVAVFFLARNLLRTRLEVREVQVGHQVLVKTVSTNGRVEPEKNYEFYSPINTTVNAVYVQAGDAVPPGRLLMELDDTEARSKEAAAESALKNAQANLQAVTHNGTQEQRQAAAADVARNRLERDMAEQNLNALSKLAATGAASPSEVSAARHRLAIAQSALHAAEQNLNNRYSPADVARAQAALADAEANLEAAQEVIAKTVIRAPIKGTVYTVNALSMQYVEAGKLLLEMADLGRERVRAYFDEPDIGRLQVGQSALIKWDAMPGEEWHGHISRTPTTIVSYGTRNVGEVLVEFDKPNSGLLPDTNVTVTVTTASERNALSVPREALYYVDGKPCVYRVVNNALVRTPVVTSIINLTQASIVSGLSDGEWVAVGTTDGEPLQEGVPIRVVR